MAKVPPIETRNLSTKGTASVSKACSFVCKMGRAHYGNTGYKVSSLGYKICKTFTKEWRTKVCSFLNYAFHICCFSFYYIFVSDFTYHWKVRFRKWAQLIMAIQIIKFQAGDTEFKKKNFYKEWRTKVWFFLNCAFHFCSFSFYYIVLENLVNSTSTGIQLIMDDIVKWYRGC